MTGVALHHLIGWLEARVRDFCNRQLFVVSLLSADHRGIGNEREMNTRVRNQIGLELGQINVKTSIESERGRDGGHNLSDQTIQVGVGWALDVEIASADVIDGLVINHESTVRVFQGSVGGKDGIVWLDNGGGNLWCGVHGEFQLGFLAIVNAQTLQQKSTKSRTGTTTERVENQKSLQTRAVIGQLADSVKNQVHNFLSNGVVTTGIVVSGIFFSSDQLLRVEKLTVGSSADLIHNGWLQIHKDGTGNMFSSTSLQSTFTLQISSTSEKKVLKESSPPPMVLSDGI